MTLDDVISFVSKNQGRKLPTIGGRKKFSVEPKGESKTFVFVTEKATPRHENHDWIEKSLRIFNDTHSFKIADYKATKTQNASYVLGLFRQIVEDQKRQANIESTLTEDINAIMSDKSVDSTIKLALVDARVGQGKFRSSVLRLWNYRCSVTKSCTVEAIRASHIKPWRDSTDRERLDPANGLPLVASLDALFDAGLISFEDSGLMLVSPRLPPDEQKIYGVVEMSLTNKPPPETATYLRYLSVPVWETTSSKRQQNPNS